MIPTALMDTLQATVLVLVAAGALVVVRTKDRIRLVLMLSVYGILLAVLFLVFQAPDVTLSELTVGAVLLPLILLLALAKVREPDTEKAARGKPATGKPEPGKPETRKTQLGRNEP
jgi:energy-converting hydrogenase B subunit D